MSDQTVLEENDTSKTFLIKVPKNEYLQEFTDYVISNTGDLYEKKTEDVSVKFDPAALVIDIYNKIILEKDLNETPSRIWELEHIKSQAEVLLESIQREEEIWSGTEYQRIFQDEYDLPGTKKSTEAGKKYAIMSKALDDPIGQLFWKYIGRSKQDIKTLDICIKALTSHLFKCKQLYDSLYAKRSESNESPKRDIT